MHIAICDDQNEWIELIESYLVELRRTYRNIKWESFSSAEELILYSKTNKYVFDVLITDIEMKEINGITLANKVRENDSGLVIFFLTNHEEYMHQCFEPSPLNFWDKPIEYEQFKGDMERAMKISKENERVFSFKCKDGYWRIPFKNIIYFATNGKKITVHTKLNDYEFYGSFKEYEKLWGKAGFVKANRFYNINSTFILRLKSPDIFLTTGEKIQATPSNIKNIKMMLFENDCINVIEQMGDEF